MTYERSKWERLARELAATLREQEQLEQRLVVLRSKRAEQERVLWRELEKEQAPLGPEVWQAEQDAKYLDPWAPGRPAPEQAPRRARKHTWSSSCPLPQPVDDWCTCDKFEQRRAMRQEPVLRGVDIGRPAGSRLRWCALKDCGVQGPHGHGTD